LLRRSTRDHGFTLLELIVVIFIIGLVSSVILLRTGAVRFERKTSVYAQQLESFLQVCQQQALLQPAVIGILFTKDKYGAYYFEEGKQSRWVALAGKDNFWRAREIPTDIALRITASVAFHAGVITPQIVIQPSGDLTPFTINIGYANEAPRYRLSGNDAGEIFLQDLK
jgi:general secretion pathway protein H